MTEKLRGYFKRDIAWGGLFLLVLLFFYPELWLAKSAPLVSDHWEQHYPWAWTLYQSLRQMRLPLWTPLIQCGFPIAAESQIGIFYLPNFLLSVLLPFKAAYSYTLLVHFAIAGWGTFVYGRIMGLIRPAAFLAAFVFVFGTSYGGAYYNITSLKTLAWFPVMLWLWEKWLGENKIRWLLMLAVVGSQSLVAGYLQVAALSLFIFGVYAVMRLWIEIQTQAKKARAFARWAAPAMIFALLGVLLALPQILLTFQMAIESNRTGTSEAYAYVGSLSPLALFTLLLPNLQGLFRGNCLYGGFFAFFCVLAASKQGEKNGVFFKVWAVLSIFCLLLALGQWSPLYVGLIKLTHFYSFRTPAKFLIFFNFSLAMLAAIGFQKLWLSCENEKGRMWIRWKGTQFIVTLGLISGFIFIAKYALIFQRDYLTSLGEWVLRETLYGRAGHPHSWDVYQTKLQEMLAFADDVFSFKYRWTVWITGVFACGVAWGIWLKKTKRLRGALIAGFFLLAADLYGFSYADLRSDFSEYAQVEPQNKTIKTLMKARSQNTLGRIYGLRIGDQVPSLIPSVNMLYAIEDVGSYSPLVSSRYYETVGLFGNVNDSNQVMPVSIDFVLDRLSLLSALDVSHILSPVELPDSRLTPVSILESGERVYQLNLPRSRAFFPKSVSMINTWSELRERLMAAGFDPRLELLVESSEVDGGVDMNSANDGRILSGHWGNGTVRYEIEAQEDSFFVIMQSDAPGWRFTLNGLPIKIVKAYGIFQAFFIDEPGRYVLQGHYDFWEAMTGRSH